MAEQENEPKAAPAQAYLGLFTKLNTSQITPADMIAIALSIIWVIGAGLFFLFADTSGIGSGALTFIMIVMAIFFPVAVIWMGAIAARSAQIMRTESERLQASIDAMRQAYVVQAQTGAMGSGSSVERKLDAIAAAQRKAESALAGFNLANTSAAPVAPAPSPDAPETEGQPALALGTPADALDDPLSNSEFIRALNFPDNENDIEGFTALRRALKDHRSAKLVRAAQDMLTLLSQDGIYTDDLLPDRPRADIWRRFAKGERGKTVSGFGGIRDRSSLALSAGRMKQDQIFRDTAHHFLREFDRVLSEFAKNASDDELISLSDTRSARAFMLLGRVAGTFD